MQLFMILTSPTPNQQYPITTPMQQIIIIFLLLPRQPWKETKEVYLSQLLQTLVEKLRLISHFKMKG